jgi:uncharacterized RDD family membrane protein YckC
LGHETEVVIEEDSMHCSKCGALATQGAAFCGSCGQPIVGYSVAPPTAATYEGGAAATIPATTLSGGHREFAGFWLRFVAYVIDGLISCVVLGIVVALVIGFIGFGTLREQFQQMDRGVDPSNPVFPAMLVITIFTFVIFALVASWLYYAGMESSAHQGTLGKMALGLVVTDMEGRPVSFARATGRFFSRLITRLIPLAIGYIMAGFTEKKQALHDMIAGCLVLRKA